MNRSILILLSCVLFLPACVATSRDMETVQYQMDMRLDRRIQQLEQEIANTREILDERIAEESQPVRSTQANLWAEIENLKVKVATLEGRVGELDQVVPGLRTQLHNATATLSDLTAMVTELEQELAMVSSQLGLGQEAPVTAGDAGSGSPSDEEPDTLSAQDLYNQALSAFNDRKYEQAQSFWEEFVTSFPDHELVPNALFWQGESFYQLKDYNRAVLSYQEVIEGYPDSNKYPSALLKQGLSFYALGKNKAGSLLLEEVIQKFPQSAETRRARLFQQNR